MQDITIEDRGPVSQDGSFKVTNIQGGEARMELSSQWFKRPDDQRFLSLSALRDYTKKRYEMADTLRLRNKEIEFLAPTVETMEDTHKLSLGLPNGNETVPNNWSFTQLSRLAGAPASYLSTLPSQIVADNLTWGMRQNREVEEVKAYYQPDGSMELHALTGPDYGRIPDYEVAEAVMQIAGNGTGDARWKVPGVMDWSNRVYNPHVPVSKNTTTLFASDRDIFLFLVDDLNPIEIGKTKDGEPDLVFRGFYVKQSEMGSASLTLAAMYLRSICCNRILWGVEGFREMSIRHTKSAPSRFMEEARPALESLAEGSTIDFMAGVEKAKAAQLAKDEDEALAWLQGRKFTKAEARKIVKTSEEEEGKTPRSAWDMAQGITAVARSIPHQDQRVTFERRAGAILDKVAKAA